MKKVLFFVVLMGTLMSCSNNMNQDVVNKHQLPRSGDSAETEITDYNDEFLLSQNEVLAIADSFMYDLVDGTPTLSWVATEDFLPIYEEYFFPYSASPEQILYHNTHNLVTPSKLFAVVNYSGGGYAVLAADNRVRSPFLFGSRSSFFPAERLNLNNFADEMLNSSADNGSAFDVDSLLRCWLTDEEIEDLYALQKLITLFQKFSDFYLGSVPLGICVEHEIDKNTSMDEEIAILNAEHCEEIENTEINSFDIALTKLLIHHEYRTYNSFCSTLQDVVQLYTTPIWNFFYPGITLSHLGCITPEELAANLAMKKALNSSVYLYLENDNWRIIYGYITYESCDDINYSVITANCLPVHDLSFDVIRIDALDLCNIWEYQFN